jgi:hypothetical protein
MINSEQLLQIVQNQVPVLALTLKLILIGLPFVAFLEGPDPSKTKG